MSNLTEERTTYLQHSVCGFEGAYLKNRCPNSSTINLTKLEEPKGVTLHIHALLPGLDTCGWSMILRMAIGPKFFDHQYPWTALLVYQAGNQEKNYCGGTLISDRYVREYSRIDVSSYDDDVKNYAVGVASPGSIVYLYKNGCLYIFLKQFCNLLRSINRISVL